MGLISKLEEIHGKFSYPFLIGRHTSLSYDDIKKVSEVNLDSIRQGDVVALIGDFEPLSIQTLLRLIDMNVILVPLTTDTRPDHEYFFDVACVDVVVEGNKVTRIRENWAVHTMLQTLREEGHPGLVLFSSGTTGRPKAILHNFEIFLKRYETKRPALRTISFLLFDHIGGINTLLHTLFNKGVVVIPSERTPAGILKDIETFSAEVLPTTPTFLRILLMSGLLGDDFPKSLKIITYGTERMDQVSLEMLCEALPNVDFRQTFGMSELGILRVKSKSRNSLWMKVGGEGVTWKVKNNCLFIKSETRMLGYINAPSPFDGDGWYDTKDLVEQDGEWLKVVGRANDLIITSGLKVLPSEIERAALLHPHIMHAIARGKENPITGQHIELTCELVPDKTLSRKEIKHHMREHLSASFLPHKIIIDSISIGHRFKKS